MKIGELCAGYGGLGLGLAGDLTWYSEIDKGPLQILRHRYPHVPNLGDMTAIDWTHVEPVDVLAAGFPCQPVSHAGKRLGDLDERWLWDDVARAVRALRPRHVLLENVRGLLTARGGALFGRVLGTLADLGYDTRWEGVRASDVGAPHQRFRVFIVATAHGHGSGRGSIGGIETGLRDTHGRRSEDESRNGPQSALFPTPRTSDANGAGTHGTGGIDLRTAVQLLPTPTARDWKDGAQVDNVPTNGLLGRTVWPRVDWGKYRAAIERWEDYTRPAPEPTILGKTGRPQLSPRFVEWMMGLPEGWVTDVPDLTRSQMLKALGNGVVPQQAAHAVWLLTSDLAA